MLLRRPYNIPIYIEGPRKEIRSLWIQRINAAVREGGMSYSEFIGKLKKSNINLNRKVLADIAMNDPDSFKQILKSVS